MAVEQSWNLKIIVHFGDLVMPIKINKICWKNIGRKIAFSVPFFGLYKKMVFFYNGQISLIKYLFPFSLITRFLGSVATA